MIIVAFLIVAVILFILAACNVNGKCLPIGLACVAFAMLLERWPH